MFCPAFETLTWRASEDKDLVGGGSLRYAPVQWSRSWTEELRTVAMTEQRS
jgi:hypothetical protein